MVIHAVHYLYPVDYYLTCSNSADFANFAYFVVVAFVVFVAAFEFVV